MKNCKKFKMVRNTDNISIRFMEQEDLEISRFSENVPIGALVSKTKNGWLKVQTYGPMGGSIKIVEYNERR